MLLAEFAQAHRLREAAEAASRRGYKLIDAFTPFPVEGVAEMLDGRPSKVRVFMFAGGILIAAIALGGEYYTAVIDYPYNAGGRPLNSWPSAGVVGIVDDRSIVFARSEEHTSELQSHLNLVCRLLLEKKKIAFRFSHIR